MENRRVDSEKLCGDEGCNIQYPVEADGSTYSYDFTRWMHIEYRIFKRDTAEQMDQHRKISKID